MRPTVVVMECRDTSCQRWLAAAPRERLTPFLERARGEGWSVDPDRCPEHARALLSAVPDLLGPCPERHSWATP